VSDVIFQLSSGIGLGRFQLHVKGGAHDGCEVLVANTSWVIISICAWMVWSCFIS
jgi:hypothetical protein